jgi:hypothetical protein
MPSDDCFGMNNPDETRRTRPKFQEQFENHSVSWRNLYTPRSELPQYPDLVTKQGILRLKSGARLEAENDLDNDDLDNGKHADGIPASRRNAQHF